jgi:hypothetical protein
VLRHVEHPTGPGQDLTWTNGGHLGPSPDRVSCSRTSYGIVELPDQLARILVNPDMTEGARLPTLRDAEAIDLVVTADVFSPMAAIDFGVLGTRVPWTTDSGLESVACCNGTVGPN